MSCPPSRLSCSLTCQRIFFQRNGFVTFPEFLSPAGLRYLRRRVDEIYRDKAGRLLPMTRVLIESAAPTGGWRMDSQHSSMSPARTQLDVESCYPPQECATPAHASRVTRASVVDMLQSFLGADFQLYASQVHVDCASLTPRSSLITLMSVTLIPSRRQLLLFVLVFACLTSPVSQLHRKVSAGAHGHGGHAVPIHQDGDENVARAAGASCLVIGRRFSPCG